MLADQLRGRTVGLRYRDPKTNQRINEKVKDIIPYCFITVEDSERIPKQWIDAQPGFKGLYGETLVKITFGDPYDMKQFVKDNRIKTWEANIPFPNRVLADRKNPIPQYKWRKVYLDGEWKIESGEITILALYDNYTGRMYQWVQKPDEIAAGTHQRIDCKNHPEGKTHIDYDTHLIAFNSERDLLEHFAKHLRRLDPDMIIGWALQWADIKQIAQRMKACGLNPGDLSPYKKHRFEYMDWDQPIPGVVCMDLMTAFEKLWVLKHGQLASKKLDNVAWEALKERKLELPDGHDTFYTDVGTYLDYNLLDVELMPRLDALLNVSEHYISLAHACQIRFRDTPLVTKLATSLFIMDEDFDRQIPSKPQFGKVEYPGADIQEPVPGIYPNVGIMDVKAMYHSNAEKANISWDTLDENGVDCGNGSCFTQESKGLLVRTMDKLTEARNEYKVLMKTDPENKSTWDAMQHAMKSLVASLYGICGDSKFGMYHPEIASAITYTSRQTLFQLRDICEEYGHTCRYGHTDSVFVDIDAPEIGEALIVKINERMFPIVTEFEKWCSSFFIKAKNRYACRVSWTDGSSHEPQTYLKGLELIQARMPMVMKDAMKFTLDAMLMQKDQHYVDEYLITVINDTLAGRMDGDQLFMRGKLKKNLDKYDTLSGPAAGAAWANKHLGKGYKSGDYFDVAINQQGQYIAFDDVSDIEGITKIGYRIMVERFIVKKVMSLYEVVNWSPQQIINSMNGVGETEWL
jgi:DNA polymerase elongation subunit (family B)